MRATSHARVDGRAEVSVRGRVEFRCVLERVRVRRTPAGPLRSIQLEASRGHAGDATPVAPIRCDTPGDGRLRRLGSGLPPVLERRRSSTGGGSLEPSRLRPVSGCGLVVGGDA